MIVPEQHHFCWHTLYPFMKFPFCSEEILLCGADCCWQSDLSYFLYSSGKWALAEVPGDMGAAQQAPFRKLGILRTHPAQQLTCPCRAAQVSAPWCLFGWFEQTRTSKNFFAFASAIAYDCNYSRSLQIWLEHLVGVKDGGQSFRGIKISLLKGFLWVLEILQRLWIWKKRFQDFESF